MTQAEVGDWYFALDGRAPTAGRTQRPWTEAFRNGDHALFTQACSKPSDPRADSAQDGNILGRSSEDGNAWHWVGSAWHHVQSARGRVWLFGETRASRDDMERVAWSGADPALLGERFVLISRSEKSGQIEVITDRLGVMHAYYGPAGFGSSMAGVSAGSRRQLDVFGLAGFFSFGFFPGDHTQYQDVRIFQPARRYVYGSDSQGWRQERYWEWHHRPRSERTYEETLDEFCALIRQIMGEIDQDGVALAIPISGGLDSRLTLAALDGEREGRWSYSYGYGPRSAETRIARRLADRRRIPFESIEIEPYLFSRHREVMAAVEGFQDATQTRQTQISPLLRRHGGSVVAAHWGDVWLDDMGWRGGVGTEEDVIQHALSRLQKRGSRWLVDQICAPRLEEKPSEALANWVGGKLSHYAAIEDPDFRIKAFKTDHWSFRWTVASLRAYQLGAKPRLPFYDPRLVDFFTGVPTEFVAGRRLEIDAIKRLAPDLARVPWQVYDASLYTWQHFNTWHLPKRAMKKAWRLLRRERVLERNWEVQFLHDEGRAALESHLTQPGLPLHDWVEPSAVRGLLDAFNAEPLPATGYTVSMLLTFSMWLQSQ